MKLTDQLSLCNTALDSDKTQKGYLSARFALSVHDLSTRLPNHQRNWFGSLTSMALRLASVSASEAVSAAIGLVLTPPTLSMAGRWASVSASAKAFLVIGRVLTPLIVSVRS